MGQGIRAGARVLFIEDDSLLRDGVSAALESYGYWVHAVGDGTDLLDNLDDINPDLALLDVTLPTGPDGFELARCIRSRSDIPVFFLTAADSSEDLMRGFDLGADDYLVKPFSTRELALRIRAVLRRSSPSKQEILTIGDVQVHLDSRRVFRDGHLVGFTPTEFEVMAALAQAPDRSLSKRDLLLAVWGLDEHAPHMVEVHISAIRRKLEEFGHRVVVTGRDGNYFLTA